MFSRDQALHPIEKEPADTKPFIRISFQQFLQQNDLAAGFLCLWNDPLKDLSVIVVEGIPEGPFLGLQHSPLVDFLKDCLERYPAPHVHTVSRSELWSAISRVKNISEWQPKALFIPAYMTQMEFLLLCFSSSDSELQMNEHISATAASLVKTASFLLEVESLSERLRVMEIYVREVGHDIASSVQAIVSRLRNVSRGLLKGKAALVKVREAEEEIMSAYRIADTLGITVDPDYNIGDGDYFDARDPVRKSVQYCLSEAEERHIELRLDVPNRRVSLWGDEKGIQSAVIQLMINAIKYAKGSSYVTARVEEKDNDVEFSVTDLGKPIDEMEKAHMWEFGWRGEKAKELHVNGSGIGLYTVRKIAQAHGGTFGIFSSHKSTQIVTFYFRISKGDIMRKTMLLKRG